MSNDSTERPYWTRREFIRAGLAAAGTFALAACGHRVNSHGSLAFESSADLDALARSIRGRLLLSKSSGYDDARRVWNLAYDRHPLAMARCADLDDVRHCVEFARRHSVPVAIRGGGHSYAGHGVADGALQIDLAAFNTVTVDTDRRVASVGGGTRIKELLATTLPVGLITPMGACGDVGVAGLALAGGDTAGRGLFGTACDNVLGAQIVTSDGGILELSPDRNEELFWAIRGGGGNFGVVTRLDLRLHSVLPYHTAAFEFGWNDIAGAMHIFGELVQRPPDEIRAGFFVDPVSGASASCGFYGDKKVAGAYLAKWKAAFHPVEPRMANPKPNPQGEIWTTTSLAVDGAFLEGMTGDVVNVLARAAVAGRGIGGMLMGLSNGIASRVGMTDTAYPLRGTGLSSLLHAEWNRPQDREAAMQWVAEHGAALRPWARRAYVNYLAPSTPDRIREVYGVNYPRLARIKAQYDPANLFRSNQNILPEAGR